MNKLHFLFTTLLIFSTITGKQPDAASKWELFGLKDEFIRTLLPMPPGFGDNAIMVGTSRGIWWHEYDHWMKIWEGPAVHAMEMLPDNRILAVAGNGSDTDGVYLGTVIAIAEPGTIYGFAFKAKCPYPTALGMGPMIDTAGITDDGCEMHFYVGTIEGVHHGKICVDTISWLPSLSIPSSSFSSFCSAVHVFSGDTMIYAGGYSLKRLIRMGKRAIVADPEAYLLRGRQGGLQPVKKSNTTAISELIIASKPFLAVATLDSGVQIFSEGQVTSTLLPPVLNEPITAMTPFITQHFFDGRCYSSLAVATPSGVYKQCLPDENCIWSTLGNPPGRIKCLAQQNGTTLWAGTDSGLYRYGETSGGTTRQLASFTAAVKYKVLRTKNGSTTFNFQRPFSGTIVFYSLRGEVLDRVTVDGEYTVRVRVGKGIRLFRLYRGGCVASVGSIAYR